MKKVHVDEGWSTVKERFEGADGRRLLIDALKTQKLVTGNAVLAEELAGLVEVMEVRTGETIIRQGASDNDLFFILTGSFNIVVNGKVVAKRSAHDHVGEMAAIEQSQARTATVVADEDSVICKLSEPQLADVGQRYSDIWRYFARELVRRLAQRNAFVNPARERFACLFCRRLRPSTSLVRSRTISCMTTSQSWSGRMGCSRRRPMPSKVSNKR